MGVMVSTYKLELSNTCLNNHRPHTVLDPEFSTKPVCGHLPGAKVPVCGRVALVEVTTL